MSLQRLPQESAFCLLKFGASIKSLLVEIWEVAIITVDPNFIYPTWDKPDTVTLVSARTGPARVQLTKVIFADLSPGLHRQAER